MAELYQELEDWFKKRPAWMQEAAQLLIKNSEVSKKELPNLLLKCQKEANEELVNAEALKREQLTFGEAQETIKIFQIKEIKGVNALSPRKPLVFGHEQMSIVYGGNGTGKSGYTRTLKHIFGAKNLESLLENIYKDKPDNLECKIDIVKNGNVDEIHWQPQLGILKELSSVEIFDSECADVYATKENETVYEPYIMRLFSLIIEACGVLSREIDSQIDALPSTMPTMPIEYKDSDGSSWCSELSKTTEDSEIEKYCSWSPELDIKLKQTNDRLSASNPKELAEIERRVKQHIDGLSLRVKTILNSINENACKIIVTQKKEALQKRKGVEKEAKLVFDDSSLDGVGQETWKSMWKAAKKYSVDVAYKESEFPNIQDDALCLLCQQPLDNKSKERYSQFENFVTSTLENEAQLAEETYANSIDSFPEIPQLTDIEATLDSCKIEDAIFKNEFEIFIEEIRKRTEWIKSAESLEGIPKISTFKFKEYLDDKGKSHEELAKKYDIDAKGENRDRLQLIATKLKAQKWLSEQKKAVEAEIKRKKSISSLLSAKKLTNTQALSAKKSSISDVILSAEYLDRFKSELTKLGAKNLNVEIVKTGAKLGKVYHQLIITNTKRNANLQDVLSQGEYRIVSLAAFLADAGGRAGNSPFIFDDPISSLDQEYEEKLIDRLVELSKNRQVIIFTHRLSLLSMLKYTCKNEGVSLTEICLRTEPWGKGEPSETSFFAKKPKQALNTLKGERLAKAKKIYEQQGEQEYEFLAKGICSDFRILLESVIENILLNEVVLRYKRGITTKDKLGKLPKIVSNDCQLLDYMMTKYSKYEHSQSKETPTKLPKPPEIEIDITKITDWIKEFNDRS